MDKMSFINYVAEIAVRDWKERRIMLPSVVIAQACKESAFGMSELAINANALFGIKFNDWTGSYYVKKADEQNPDGSMRTDFDALWRKYESWEQSILDHSTYIAERKVGNQAEPNFKAIIGETNIKKVIAGFVGNANRSATAERCTDPELKQYVLEGKSVYPYATGLNYPQSLLDDYITKYNLTQYDVIEEVKNMDKKVLVVLDPGHYPNYNKGAVGGYFEGDKMYDFSEYERDALKAYGIDVIITRGRSNDMNLYDRGQVAVKNGSGYDEVVFISNHSNACNGQAYGVEVYRSLYLPGSEELGKKLVNAIIGVMKSETGITKSRGVKTRKGNNGDYYGVIRGSVSGATSEAQAKRGPVTYSFIVEHGFHDNIKECTFLNNASNLKKMAQAEAKVIADYFGLTAGSSTQEEFKTEAKPVEKKSIDVIAQEVIAGKWGNGADRKARLKEAGYNYTQVQAKVNKLLS